jgi:hypothetical protein
MRRVSYSGASFLTTDRASDALLSLAAALSNVQSSEVVEIAAIDDDGEPMVVKLVLRVASGIISLPESSSFPEPDTTDSVDLLICRAQALSSVRSGSFVETVAVTDFDVDSSDYPD